jgi:drug/metabolite transporter superfamily protein YnfA
LILHALVGWAICGATIGVGRQVVSMNTTLLIHAAVAPLTFAVLTWRFFRRFRASSALAVALTMLGVVVGLDAFLVAPFFERSYAMFGSVLGTWLPFASIFAASYLVGGACKRRGCTNEDGKESAAHTTDDPASPAAGAS